jgi:hypothetical protein
MKRSIAVTIILFCICLLYLKTAQANEIIHTVLKRVVMIIAMDENYQPIAIGSGFIIGENGEIATNYSNNSGLIQYAVFHLNEKPRA